VPIGKNLSTTEGRRRQERGRYFLGEVQMEKTLLRKERGKRWGVGLIRKLNRKQKNLLPAREGSGHTDTTFSTSRLHPIRRKKGKGLSGLNLHEKGGVRKREPGVSKEQGSLRGGEHLAQVFGNYQTNDRSLPLESGDIEDSKFYEVRK